MTLQATDVTKIAHLARMEITDQDTERYAKELSSILDLVAQLNQASTDQVTPMAHPLHMHQRLRDDVVTEYDQHSKYQTIAPLTVDGLYLVPKVID
ncbi:glutamyl-tRNA amidotransferase [Achromatium sp. WMS2]|nr:glutamyl-tRNA amidotransferase [Achromatium sp. WMS2]